MSDKKTILFNDSFMTSMGGSKTKKNRKPKKEKPTQAVKPNKLKKDLLEKIKKHQQNEKIKKKPNMISVFPEKMEVTHRPTKLNIIEKL